MSERTVLLVNSNQMRPPVAPLALDYLAHALEQKGFEADILDLCFAADCDAAVRDYFAGNDVFAVAVTFRNIDDSSYTTKHSFLPELKKVVDCLRAHTSAPIILGGAGFSVMPRAALEYCGADMGVWGEGEHSLPLLLDKMMKGDEVLDVPALVYRAGDGFRVNAAHYLDLAAMPPPPRSLVDNRRYFEEGGMNCLETKRGCPKGCIYCVDPLSKGTQVRLRSPSSVGVELETLLGQGIDHFHLCDSEFNIPEHHAEEVCNEIAGRGLGDKVRWYTYACPAPFSRELAHLMKRAGCVGVNFGVDAGCDRMLKTLGRDFSVEDVHRTARLCREAGITFMYDLLLGGPGETKESLRETVETMKQISPDRIGAAMGIRVYPKTKLADMVYQEGPMQANRNLHGSIGPDNEFVAPVFYLSDQLGDDARQYLADLVDGDERFLLHTPEAGDKNYNYDDNMVLVRAIRQGHRGAFWDILRRLSEEKR